jgi:hypothetical protein
MSWIEDYYKSQEKLMRNQAKVGQAVGQYGVERDTADLGSLKAGQLPGTMTEDWQRQIAANRRKRQTMLGGQRGTGAGTIANAMLTASDERGEAASGARMFESWRDQRRAALESSSGGAGRGGITPESLTQWDPKIIALRRRALMKQLEEEINRLSGRPTLSPLEREQLTVSAQQRNLAQSAAHDASMQQHLDNKKHMWD